jgi:hypothetical protein
VFVLRRNFGNALANARLRFFSGATKQLLQAALQTPERRFARNVMSINIRRGVFSTSAP